MRVHHIDCGTMCPHFSRLISGTGGLVERTRLVCHCVAVELKSGGFALVDTGIGSADIANPWKRLGPAFMLLAEPTLRADGTALAQLGKLGIQPRDVRHLLPTHLDLDHAGGIADFPDATVHVLAREHHAASAPKTRVERERYKPAQWSRARFQHYEPGGDSWFGFEAVRALPGTDDEILLIPLFGHTRGHVGVAIHTEKGWLLHAGDAYFHHDEIHAAVPSCPPALAAFQSLIQMDGRARRDNQQRLRALAYDHRSEVTVFCAHDASELAALR